MANTNSKDLEERLSPWGVSMEEQETGHGEAEGHHSPTPKDELNEKLSPWGVELHQQQESDTIGESPPRSPQRSPAPAEAKGTDDMVDAQLSEKVSPWGVNLGDTGDDSTFKVRLLRGGSEVELKYFTKKGLMERLLEWGINTETIEHPEVFTVEQALPHLSNFEGMFAKNLFLRDKKRKLYLFCAAHDADITLNDLARRVGASGGLRLADPELLEQKLGLKQGAVTIFGLINDQFHDVQLILHNRLIDGTYQRILFHPMVNCATTALSPEGLKSFLEHTGHEPVLIDISHTTVV